MSTLNNSYWNNNGTFQTAVEQLQKRIPTEGSVPFPRSKNKMLERLRRAINCYYDLYNNGLGNRDAQFYQIFGRKGDVIVRVPNGGTYFSKFGVAQVEKTMDDLIIAAAHEQGIALEADNPRYYGEYK